MRYALTDEQQMFQEALRGWLDGNAPIERVREWIDAGDHRTFEGLLVDAGWAAVGVPEDLGGQGGGLVELALAAEEFGRGAAPATTWMGNTIVIQAVEGLPEEVVTGAVSGEAPVALAVDASAPVGSRTTVHAASGARLTGEVPMVLGAGRARHLVVPAVDGGAVGLWLVDTAAAGVERQTRRPLDRTRALADVRFTDVEAVPIDGDGPTALASARDRTGVLVAAGTVGAADRLLAMAVEYSLQREQFGQPIGSFQAVKHEAARMLVAIEPVRSVARYAAWSVEAGDPKSPLHTAVAKAQASAMGVSVAESALTMHGAIGFTWEHNLQLLYKRVKLDQALGGPPSVWNERVADELALSPQSAPEPQPA